jgi:4-hydroxybenzoyl-CoA reductase subunit beta
MSLPAFKLLRPRTIEEAVDHLSKHAGEIQIIAGGTDLLPSMKQRLFTPKYLLDIRRIEELHGIRSIPGHGTEIGALVTLTALEDSEFIRRSYPVLHEAVATIASPILRNMGTIGGNICLDTRCLWYNQSLTWRKSCGFCVKKDGDLCHVAPGGKICWAAFSADSPAALLCLDAELEIANSSGFRRVPLADFYTNIGDARMKLAQTEMLTRVFLPDRMAGYRGAYHKLRLRGSIDYPLAGVAVSLKTTSRGFVDDARVAITAVNPSPILVHEARHALVGRVFSEHAAEVVGELAARVAKPLTTSILTPEYRKEMIRVYAKRAVIKASRA